MSLFFDTKVQFIDSETVSTIVVFHPFEAIFAVAGYGDNRGGTVTIFDDSGEPLKDINFPNHPVSQATSLAFHPQKQILISGWENGEIHAWISGKREFMSIQGSGYHKSPVMLVEFSEQGGRLVTADSNGTLTGWRCDNQGQFLTMFSHDLRDPLLHITFRKTIENTTNAELMNLAKLAVAGDQVALDTITTWRPKTAARNLLHTGVKDNHCFYVGSQSGVLFYVNQSGTCTEVLRTDSPIIQILFHPKREAIVTLMEDMTISHFLVENSGNLTELDRVKLSSRISGYDGNISWAGNSLAIITGDLTVRILDIDTSENFLLPTDHSSYISKAPTKSSQSEIFTAINYCTQNQKLCASTNQGAIYIWKKTLFRSENESEWQLTDISKVRGSIKQCIWGNFGADPCIVANCVSNMYILKEQPLMSYHTRDLWTIQRASNQVIIIQQSQNTQQQFSVNCDISVTNVCLNDLHLVLTNGKTVMVYKIQKTSQQIDTLITTTTTASSDIMMSDNLTTRFLSSFSCENFQLFIYNENVICINQTSVIVMSLNGVKLQEHLFTDHEGKILGAELTNKYLTITTMNAFIKIYDISRHELKLIIPVKSAYDLFDSFGEIIAAKANCDGTFCAITIANDNLVPDGKLYVWKLETDTVIFYDFVKLPRLPISFSWDTDDPRLLGCEAKLITKSSKKSTESNISMAESQVFIMFPTNTAILEIEVIDLTTNEKLINLCAPNLITLKTGTIEHKCLRDFIGLQNIDAETRKMILDFSLNVAQGNLDQAFSCIRSLKSDAIWNNLAKMCVQTRRLDVAIICLGHLRKARSVRAVRKAMNDPSLEEDAKTAALAIELGMIEDAENLYKKCGRYDLLNKLLQNCGRFEEALKIAEHDRVHLKNTRMKYAHWLSENGRTAESLKMYQMTNDPVHNITQLLMEDPNALRKYMQSTTDPEMLKWYAQYIESTGDMESAFKIYQKSEDYFSQVRILCFLGQISKADSVARTSGDKSACYHLARQYESIGKFHDAIQFYTKAQTYGNAIRICKENDYQDELWNVAIIANKKDKITSAVYFEEVGDYKRAVELYHRADFIHKAIELAFSSQQPDILQVIASELNEKSDPELVKRCAEFFQSINLFQKAVMLLASTRQFDNALNVCFKHAVPMTESLAEILTPQPTDEIDDEMKNEILTKIGSLLQEQGDYHLATKKFTQAGDKIQAMKSLLKSGDTEKIVFFASMSRQKEIYIMAGNYLQSLDWQNDPKILKNITTFYTKGQAYDLLANFYVVAAQAEVDDYRDYVKALKSLQDAAKCLLKISSNHSALETLQHSIFVTKKVIEIQDLIERKDYYSVIGGCRSLLTQKEQTPVRHSDILGLLIEAQTSVKQYSEALASLRELALKQPDWSSREIIDRALIERLANEMNIDFNQLWNSGRKTLRKQESIDESDDDEEEIEETIRSEG